MRRQTIAALFAVELVWFGCLVFALMDRRVHQRDPVLGVNQWGYRGEARAEREPGEIRVAIVGGSGAYDAGVELEDTLTSQLFFELRAAGAPLGQPYSVVNLSEPRAGADTYVQTLHDYDFLAPDIIVVFDGYDALEGMPPHARRRSAVYRATGYLPILPARLLGRPEWLSDPPGAIADVLRDNDAAVDVSCDGASAAYCAAMADVVRVGVQRGRFVAVIGPPVVSRRHGIQPQSLDSRLMLQFAGEKRFVYVDLAPWVDMSNPANSPDGVRRTLEGNHIVAQQTGIAILRLLASAR